MTIIVGFSDSSNGRTNIGRNNFDNSFSGARDIVDGDSNDGSVNYMHDGNSNDDSDDERWRSSDNKDGWINKTLNFDSCSDSSIVGFFGDHNVDGVSKRQKRR